MKRGLVLVLLACVLGMAAGFANGKIQEQKPQVPADLKDFPFIEGEITYVNTMFAGTTWVKLKTDKSLEEVPAFYKIKTKMDATSSVQGPDSKITGTGGIRAPRP